MAIFPDIIDAGSKIGETVAVCAFYGATWIMPKVLVILFIAHAYEVLAKWWKAPGRARHEERQEAKVRELASKGNAEAQELAAKENLARQRLTSLEADLMHRPLPDETKSDLHQKVENLKAMRAAIAESKASGDPASAQGPRGDGTDARVGETVTILSSGLQGKVLKRTTTDILVETGDCTSAWQEVENVGQDQVAAVDAREGEHAYLRDGGTLVKIVKRTTTDALLRTPNGEEKWYGIEDIRQDPTCVSATFNEDSTCVAGHADHGIADVVQAAAHAAESTVEAVEAACHKVAGIFHRHDKDSAEHSTAHDDGASIAWDDMPVARAENPQEATEIRTPALAEVPPAVEKEPAMIEEVTESWAPTPAEEREPERIEEVIEGVAEANETPAVAKEPPLASEEDGVAERSQSACVQGGMPSDHREGGREARYYIDNSELKAPTFGLGYRSSKEFAAKLPPEDKADWGSYVLGIEEGGEWLRVPSYGNQFLPIFVNSIRVVKKCDGDAGKHEVGKDANTHVASSALDTVQAAQPVIESSPAKETPRQRTKAYARMLAERERKLIESATGRISGSSPSSRGSPSPVQQ